MIDILYYSFIVLLPLMFVTVVAFLAELYTKYNWAFRNYLCINMFISFTLFVQIISLLVAYKHFTHFTRHEGIFSATVLTMSEVLVALALTFSD